MAQTDEALGYSTLRAPYVAYGVAVTLAQASGAGLRLVGDVEVVTETTVDDTGAGIIHGTLTLTDRSGSGILTQLISARLQGDHATGTIVVEREMNVPSASAYQRLLMGAVSGALQRGANLNVRLTGLAAVQIL